MRKPMIFQSSMRRDPESCRAPERAGFNQSDAMSSSQPRRCEQTSRSATSDYYIDVGQGGTPIFDLDNSQLSVLTR
jgi:hypothetical protein